MACKTFRRACITAMAVTAFFVSACSNDSGTGAGVDHGEINIPVGPNAESSENVATESSSATNSLSSSMDKPASSAEQPPASSATEVPASSAIATPASSSSSPDWRETCLDIINEYRATEGAAPLSLADEEKQTCTDEQAALDLAGGQAHGNFGYCKEHAQNTGPDFSLKWKNGIEDIAKYYLDMMWDEKKLVESGERDPNSDEDYPYIGHYLNMRSTKYTKVSCGFAANEETQKGWFNVDFY